MTATSVVKSFTTLAGSLAVCLLSGYMGWYPALPGMPLWYASLIKPVFAPPAWIFSPIWMVSFALLGLVSLLLGSLLLLYIEIGLEAPNASTLYYRQSILLPVALLLLVVSLGLLVKGIWMRRQ